MNSVKLDWSGWWLLRPQMTEAPELGAKVAVYAIMGSRLRKVKGGVGSHGREVVMFGVHKGPDSIKEHLEALRRTALGVFALKRCKEIGKHPIVYVAAMAEDTGKEQLKAVLSALYGSVPFAPEHHDMPKPYLGKPFEIVNAGQHPGLPDVIYAGQAGAEDNSKLREFSELAEETLDGEAITARPTGSESTLLELQPGMPTERIDKPPRLVDTTRIDKDVEVKFGLATEKVDKPGEQDDTEFVPRPPGKGTGRD